MKRAAASCWSTTKRNCAVPRRRRWSCSASASRTFANAEPCSELHRLRF